ncbi:MAG: Hydrolase, TatD family [Parcubacteria group bacterium GW2011_GWF2_43_11]|nr:MAG: Hydrolase, TatD family [Parcubacteria group bacterium GW2011_GWF2_43_11]
MLFDTHAHLNFNAYKEDSLEVLQRSLDNGVWMINVGSQYSTSKRAVEMAEKHEKGVWAAVGLHPIHVREEEFDYEKYKELAKSKKVVAVGEVGLDYKPEYALSKEKQKIVLAQQLKLAEELDLPVIFHCRMAHDDLIKILSENGSRIRGVVHCFTGSWKQAQEYLGMGLYLGFNGIIFKLNLEEVIKKTPLEKILIETDCPYLTPLPAVALAKAGRNEPLFVKHVAEKIAKVKELSYKEISRITTENAKKLFKI